MDDIFRMLQAREPPERTISNLSSIFPLDQNSNPETVFHHPTSKQLWADIQNKKDIQKIGKKMQEYYSDLLAMCICEEEKSVCAKIIKGTDTGNI